MWYLNINRILNELNFDNLAEYILSETEMRKSNRCAKCWEILIPTWLLFKMGKL